MHAAISEVGVLYATCNVHSGWENVRSNGQIKSAEQQIGGHAFAIVAYDRNGFWIQNSLGDGWGKKGFGQISYDDNCADIYHKSLLYLVSNAFEEKARIPLVRDGGRFWACRNLLNNI